MKLPMTNKIPGGNETQKMLRQAVSLNANSLSGIAEFWPLHQHAMLKYRPMTAAATIPSVSSHWKMPVPLPRLDALKTFGEIKRNDDADQSGADALQQPAKNQRPVTVRQRNYRNADDEQNAAQRHHFFSPQPIRQQAGEQSGNDAAEQNRGDDERQLPGAQTGRGFKIRQRAGNDAHVHAVKQPAQSGDEQEKSIISSLGAP